MIFSFGAAALVVQVGRRRPISPLPPQGKDKHSLHFFLGLHGSFEVEKLLFYCSTRVQLMVGLFTEQENTFLPVPAINSLRTVRTVQCCFKCFTFVKRRA